MPTKTIMPEGYYNGFSADKKRERVLYRDGKVLQGQELNESQDILAHRLKSVADALFKDGDVIRDAQIAVDAKTGQVRAGSGAVYLNGAVRGVPAATFSIPTSGTVNVGVRLTTKIVSPLEDPTLYNPATGSPGEGEEGAWREVVQTVWGFDGDGGEGEFYPVHTVDNGVVRAKETPPNLDSTTQAISKYDRDSTGGSYIVSGLQVRAAEDVEGRQVYTVSEGRARVNGYGIDIPTSRRLVYEAVPDLRRIDSEVTMADGSGSQRVDVAHPPIRAVRACHITVQRTESIVHGAYVGAADTLPDTSVVEIKAVRMGETTYVPGSDYKKSGDAVDWSPSGNEPSPGSTYEVTYTCIVAVSPADIDADGFRVSGAVKNTQIITTYDQALPRLDRLCLTSEGTFTWLKGVASETNAVSPAVPATMLAVATVRQTWRPEREVVNDGVVMCSFADLKLMSDRINFVVYEQARQRLQSDAMIREAGMKSGMFVDPLADDAMRDQGITQTGAVFDGVLTLPISVTARTLPGSVDRPTSRDVTPQAVLAQTLRTTSMQINPYQAFEPLPAKVTLTPAVDRWTETKTDWTSAVTQTFKRSTGTGGGSGWALLHHTESGVGTEVVSSSSAELEYLREIDVSFTISGFGPGEKLAKVTFDGLDVTPAEPPKADGAGALGGSFRIPKDVPAGSKSVVFDGAGGSHGSAVFTGQGTLTTQTLRQVTSVTRWYYDPLAQTFVVDEDMQLAGADLWFTAKGPGEVRVQIREVSGGVPTRVTLAEAVVSAADIVTTGGGHTRILFPAPVALTAGTEYALIVLCDDAETSVSVAELGKYDSLAQQWVASQPYQVGVLLSSSNASTWTAHQDRDLAFRLLRAAFTGKKSLDLGRVAVTGATDFMLMPLSEVPSSQASIAYTLTLPDETTLEVAEGQAVTFATPVTGDIGVSAVLDGSETWSPVLWPDTQALVGVVGTTADYYGRSISAKNGDTYATKAVLIYDALVPSGSGVTPEIRIDGGAWQALPVAGTTRGDDGVIEFRCETPLSNAAAIKLRFTLTGTSGARPSVGNIRFMAVV